MNYHASDTDVTDFINALRPLVVDIATSSYSGTANLKELCIELKSQLDAQKLQIQDKQRILNQTFLIISKQIDSIIKKYESNTLELRYLKYIPQRIQVEVRSGFMNIVNQQMDGTFGYDFQELNRLRKEKQDLGIIQTRISLSLEYIDEMDIELQELINKLT